jgi:hypothetical protein
LPPVQSSFIARLAKTARLEQGTPLERLQAVWREETEYVIARLSQAVQHVPPPEHASELFRQLADRLRSHVTFQIQAGELDVLRRRAESLGLPHLERAVGVALRRLDELAARVQWLMQGTSPEGLAALRPIEDSDRIYHHLSRSFRAEARVVETLAINRVATWESLALFLRSTREAESNPVRRFFDTYALFANYFEWGEESERGRRAIERMNQIHGRYFLPNEGMKYVLLNTAFTWLDGIDRIGHRRLDPLEREGFFQAHIRLGRALHIAGLSDDRQEMEAWFRERNAANASHTAFKTETFELFVRNSFGTAAAEHEVLLSAARVAMDEHYRAALGYPEPSASERYEVRAAVAALAERARVRPGAIFMRSLSHIPDQAPGAHPAELGVVERSRWLPRVSVGSNGGYPEGQRPLSDPTEAPDADLPGYHWHEIRRHASVESTWIVIDGDVYDVTGWLEQHPGGAERLREWAGKDASLAFRAAAHGPLTQVLRLNYRIGRAVDGP